MSSLFGKIVILNLLLLGFLYSSYAYELDYSEDPSKEYNGYGFGIETSNPIDYRQLQKIINNLPQKDIESLLPVLHKKQPELFRDYILMYRSRSLQEASFENPRVILVGKDAKLVMTYNGNETQKGFNNLEVMEFNSSTHRFSFYEIQFRDGKAKYSKENPQKCLNCHQSYKRKSVDPRPNWEPYNLWPGAYGSLSGVSDIISSYSRKRDAFLMSQHILEEEKVDQFFKEIAPKHSRYQLLVPMQKYKNTDRRNPNDEYFGINSPAQTPNESPVRLTEVFSHHNFRRIARIIRDSYPEIFKRYKYLLVGMGKCRRLFMPESLYEWHKKNMIKEKFNNKHTVMFYYGKDYNTFGGIELTSISGGIALIFSAFGIDTQDWSMDFGTYAKFASTERFGTPSYTDEVFYKNLMAVWGMEDNYKTSCYNLEKKSLALLEDFANSSDFFDYQNQPYRTSDIPLIKTCASCHVDQNYLYPSIPFDDEELLKDHLHRKYDQHQNLFQEIFYRTGPHALFDERMPPNRVVTAEEREELIKYLQKLYDSN